MSTVNLRCNKRPTRRREASGGRIQIGQQGSNSKLERSQDGRRNSSQGWAGAALMQAKWHRCRLTRSRASSWPRRTSRRSSRSRPSSATSKCGLSSTPGLLGRLAHRISATQQARSARVLLPARTLRTRSSTRSPHLRVSLACRGLAARSRRYAIWTLACLLRCSLTRWPSCQSQSRASRRKAERRRPANCTRNVAMRSARR